MTVVSRWATHNQMEGLGKLHWLFSITIDDEVATHKRDDAVVESWLSVEGDDLVDDAGHGSELGHDILHAEELFSLVGKHRHISVEGLESRSVRVERVVVVLDELLAHFFK